MTRTFAKEQSAQIHPEKLREMVLADLHTYNFLKENLKTQDEAEVFSELDRLLELESNLILLIIHASEPHHHKHKHAQQQLSKLPIIHAKPLARESMYSRTVAGHDEIIAPIKASRFMMVADQEGGLKAIQAAKRFDQEATLTPTGIFAFSVASDVMFRRILPEGSEPVFQPSHLREQDPELKNKVLEHLRSRYGMGSQNRTIRATETTAVQELFGLGGYWQREKTFSLRELPDSFINAFLFGTTHEGVDEVTKKYFETIYNDFTDPEERDRALFSWKPETGTDAKRLIKVNDALKIDNPLIWAFIDNIEGVKRDDERFSKEHSELMKIVTADPVHIHKIIRTLMHTLIMQDSVGQAAAAMKDDLISKIAPQINATYEDEFPEGILGTRWIDVKEYYDKVKIDLKYLGRLGRHYSLEKKQGKIRS